MTGTMIDDKCQHAIPFILSLLDGVRSWDSSASNSQPFFLGINGVQGVGKSVLVSLIQKTLEAPPYNLPTIVFSIDDIYLPHADQKSLAKTHKDNGLLQHRGQPGTHDVHLGLSVLESLKQNRPTRIPSFDKSAYHGQGDRVPESEWEIANQDPQKMIRVVLFEGWCVGFRSLPPAVLESKHAAAVSSLQSPNTSYTGQLACHSLSSLETINEALKSYDSLTDYLDAFIHVDAVDPQFVYKWRLQQEAELRAKMGAGMEDEEVIRFVNGYYPAYELYTDGLRHGLFTSSHQPGSAGVSNQESGKKQMTLVVGEDRKVIEVAVQ